MEGFVEEAAAGSRSELNNTDTYKKKKKKKRFPCVDRMVGKLEQRLCSVDAAGLSEGIKECCPESG